MSIHSEIDQTLYQLGTIEPPPGLEQRLHLGLRKVPRRFSSLALFSVALGLAASFAISAVALSPSLQRLLFPRHTPVQNLGSANTPRVVPATGGFHTSSAVHVPVEPVPVQPTPVNQGRGHSRTGRATLATEPVEPLPRGVAPSQPAARIGTADE